MQEGRGSRVRFIYEGKVITFNRPHPEKKPGFIAKLLSLLIETEEEDIGLPDRDLGSIEPSDENKNILEELEKEDKKKKKKKVKSKKEEGEGKEKKKKEKKPEKNIWISGECRTASAGSFSFGDN